MKQYAGIDLSGPSNTKDTSLAIFEGDETHLMFVELSEGVTDEEIYEQFQHKTETFIGIDAPLSYQPGGGDRPSDRALRQRIVKAGMRSGSIMTPTMTRMVYLTLRGISLSRGLVHAHIVEVHPGAAIGLRTSYLEAVLDYKTNMEAREELKTFLESEGVIGIPNEALQSSHSFDACLAAYAAWKWEQGKSTFLYQAEPPFHPFDLSC
ncbi:DUF429 domain-containing protein [Bacillus sp. RAR_GA_16]|uniref:DUF429 domain-containing protein n=1 Tax=Bacillus sp. RAR_GA_16 TaxID=2876774 RepID=UPI001CCA2F8D|nr:DUF429 domain-containing protein [Bacillus sp. RAR_GA_16]MCA0170614.1 DUF429 domain-containing protein [Bacillus sp. RAR_GA_16]